MPFANKTIRTRRRAELRRQAEREHLACFWCREPIDFTLKYPNPLSFTADHVVPTTKGGTDDLDNLVPAHAQCNVKRQNKPFAPDISFNSGSLAE